MMPKKGPADNSEWSANRNLNSSGDYNNHCAIVMLLSEKPSISPTTSTLAKEGMASAF